MPSLPDLPDVEITLRRSGRVRRFSLRVSSLDGRVTLSMPPRARLGEAMDFAAQHRDWLVRALARQTPARPMAFGALLPYQGASLRLTQGQGPIRIEGERLILPGPEAQLGPRLAAWAKAQARTRLVAVSDHYAARLGAKPSRITLRDTRSRWGSCTAQGALMYSWRLIFAPPDVLDYVAAHECAHLIEMNHSPAFWALVSALFPDWQPRRDWLRSHGASLHALRFT